MSPPQDTIVRARFRLLLVSLALLLAAPAQAQGAASALDDPLRPLSTAQQRLLCARVADLADRGYSKDAEALYKRALGRATCSEEQISKLKKPLPAPTFEQRLAVIRALEREGFDEEARKELQSLVSDNPDRDVPEDLREPTQQLGWWRELKGDLGPVAVTTVEILAAVLAVALAALLVPFLIRRLVARWETSAEIKPFNTGEAKDAAASLMSALHDHLAWLAEDRQSVGAKLVAPADAKFNPPDAVTNVLPQVALVAALMTALDRLLPRRLWLVTGTARPVDPDRGAGLTLGLADRRGQDLGQITVWENDYRLKPRGEADLAVRYARLIGPAAAWLVYRKEFGFKESSPPLGTKDWRSFATFTAAGFAQREGRTADAQLLYYRALDQDPGNLGAKLNLGGLLLHPASPDERAETTKERLAQADTLLTDVGNASDPRQSLYYHSRYLLGVADLYRDPPDTEGAKEHLSALLSAIEQQRGSDKNLDPLLHALEIPARISRESAVVVEGGKPSLDFLEDRWQSATTKYNLACLYARWSKEGEALAHLRDAIGRQPDLVGSARVDPALRPLHGMPEWAQLVPPEPESAEAEENGGPPPPWKELASALADLLSDGGGESKKA